MLALKLLQILLMREKNGIFKNINDFIKRVDPKDVNKLQLEGLVKSGSLDCIDKNRKKYFFQFQK